MSGSRPVAGMAACQSGDEVWINDTEPDYMVCGAPSEHVVIINGFETPVCRRHAEEAKEIADEIRPSLDAALLGSPAPQGGRRRG